MTNNNEAMIKIELDENAIDQVSGAFGVGAAIAAGVAIGGLVISAYNAGYTLGKDIANRRNR